MLCSRGIIGKQRPVGCLIAFNGEGNTIIMKLTVLGCWAPYPRAGGACSGYLIQAGGKNILLECGSGVLSNLQKHIDFRHLDAVVVSHLHPDHYLDLFCLRHAVSGARRLDKGLQPIPLYVPMEPEESFRQLSRYSEAFNVRAIEKLPKSQETGVTIYAASIGSIRLSFARTDHPLPAYAVKVTGGGELFYSADTLWCEYLPGFAKGADVALCEASVIEEDREYTSVGHLTAAQAGVLARKAGVPRLVVTHFWPEYNLETIKAEAESGYGRPVTIAGEGLEVEVK
ncbi:MAG: MBL fold metallo-hydrolase [Eubacteriales bacterium]